MALSVVSPISAFAAEMHCEQQVSSQFRGLRIYVNAKLNGGQVTNFSKVLDQKGKEKVSFYSRILYQSTFKDYQGQSNISVIVASGGDYNSAPTTYYMNWGHPKITEIALDGSGAFTTVDAWVCNRLD